MHAFKSWFDVCGDTTFKRDSFEVVSTRQPNSKTQFVTNSNVSEHISDDMTALVDVNHRLKELVVFKRMEEPYNTFIDFEPLFHKCLC